MLNPFSSPIRPALGGNFGAVSAAHPLAVAAGQQMLSTGGNAVDALIVAQAVLAVVAEETVEAAEVLTVGVAEVLMTAMDQMDQIGTLKCSKN